MKPCTYLSRRELLTRGLICLALSLLILPATPPVNAQTWKSIGPSGGDVRALAIDPSQPDFVYLGTTDGHIFGSRDGGGHWNLLGLAGPAGNATVTAIVVDSRDPGSLFAATWTRETYGEGGGVFLSRDGGKSWRDSGLAGHAVRALVQSPSDPDILVAGALDGIFRSRDRGRNWERISPPGDPELRDLDSLSIDPLNPDVIYAGTFHLPWKTADGGRHWLPIHRGMIDDSDVLSLEVDAANPLRIFASACSGIYRSDDAGSLWMKIQGIPYSSRRTPVIRLDPGNSAILYAGTTEGLWKSADSGATWRRISPADWVINSLAVQPPSGSVEFARSAAYRARLLVGTEQHGVLSSDDGGENFHEANEGFHHRRIVSLASNPENAAQIAAVVAGSPDSILASEDAGRTWSSLGAGLESADVRRVYRSPSGWFAALASGGLALFDSQTAAWTRVGFKLDSPAADKSRQANRDSHRPRPFTALVNDLTFNDAAWFAASDEGLFASRDHGLTWTAIPIAALDLPVDSVRASRDGRNLRIVSSRALVISDDAGTTWQWHDLPLESGGALRLEFAGPATALAVAPTGLYISRDAGMTWQKAQAGLPQAPISGLFVGPEIWLVSVDLGGLYLSRDQGTSWSRVRNDMPLQENFEIGQFQAILAVENTNLILAGSASEGLYVLDLGALPAVASSRESGK